MNQENKEYQDFIQATKQDDIDVVIKNFETCQNELFQANEYELFGEAYAIMVEYLYFADFMEQAIYYSLRYMNIVESDTVQVTMAYYNIAGTLYFLQEDYDNAQMILEEEAALYGKSNRIKEQANMMGNLGVIHILKGEYDYALNILFDAKRLLHACNNDKNVHGMMLKVNLAWAYLELNKADRAKGYLDEVLNWSEIDDWPAFKVELYTNYGRYYVLTKDYEIAYDYFHEAVVLCEEKQMESELENLYRLLSEACEENGDLTNSIKYLKKYAEISKQKSLRIQSLIRLKAKAEINLSQKEKVVRKYRDRFFNQVMEWEYDILTNTFSMKFMLAHIDELLYAGEDGPSFSVFVVMVKDLEDLKEIFEFRTLEAMQVNIAEVINGLGYERQIVARAGEGKFFVCYEQLSLKAAKYQAEELLKELKKLTIGEEEHKRGLCFNVGLVDGRHSQAKDSEGLTRMIELLLYQAEVSNIEELLVW